MLRRRFNTTGPCVEGRHYLIDPLSRLPEAPGFIEQGAYFVVHAPRQTGKTTTILALARELTRQGEYAAVYASCQIAADTEDVGQAITALIQLLGIDARTQLPPELHPPAPTDVAPILALRHFLSTWSQACPRPVVLLLDEIDSLKGSPLLSVLHQLRDGFHLDRPKQFPWSVILCGMKDVRDYKAASGGDPSRLGTSSPFNIKLKSLRFGDFDQAEVDTLLDQHTADTGQVFTPEARAQIFTYTQGQPWLTNALASEIIEEMAITGPITAEHVGRAKENLILARATHLDSLIARLNEPRVRRVLAPLLAGDTLALDPQLNDDLLYLRDLGLLAPKAPIRMANPIYREVVMRVLADAPGESIPTLPSYACPDGSLDVDRLLTEFLAFWKRHGEALGKRETYHEIAAQLVLMAWLQRVVNGGGYVEREYAIGKGAIDLQIRWPLPRLPAPPGSASADTRASLGGWQQEAFELKTRGPHDGDPLEEGLEQLDRYLDQLGLETGTLVIFDRRPDALPIAQRSGLGEAVTPAGRGVRLLRG
jgi:DNA polymerase III delta prime subunit